VLKNGQSDLRKPELAYLDYTSTPCIKAFLPRQGIPEKTRYPEPLNALVIAIFDLDMFQKPIYKPDCPELIVALLQRSFSSF
jgi:hypothetical protein